MIEASILCALAVVDGGLAGFRAYAGRDGRIDKQPARIAAVKRGAASALVPLAILAIVLLSLLATDTASFDELATAGRRMLVVYGLFAAVVAVGFVAYLGPWAEVQGLATVLVLGPGTFLRPLLILGGALNAAVGAQTSVQIMAFVAAALMIGLEYPLNRHFARSLALHPFSGTTAGKGPY